MAEYARRVSQRLARIGRSERRVRDVRGAVEDRLDRVGTLSAAGRRILVDEPQSSISRRQSALLYLRCNSRAWRARWRIDQTPVLKVRSWERITLRHLR